jgi:catechol 2,3-dioxygenase-like lactoylglutathione lyase family enzyme
VARARLVTISLAGIVLGTPDPRGLASFYERLLDGYRRVWDEPDWVMLRPPNAHRPTLSFQPEPGHTPPVWPGGPGDQQMQVHLDLLVDDLDAACAHAVDCGARLAEVQPQDDVRVFQDPDGHVFCLFVDGA